MKNLLLIFTALLISSTIFAQAPNKMSYQTVIRNSSNALVTGQGVGIQISILQGSSSGSAVYVERHTPITNANGLASFEIGSGTVVSGTFSSINWGSGTYFIKTETDPNGGSNYSITGTSQFLSVPYALHSKTADALTGGGGSSNWTLSGTNLRNSNSGNVGVGATPNSRLHVNGSSTLPAFRAQIGGLTKLLVNTNGGVAVGGNSGAPTNGLYVAGRVGIGTTSPDAPFTIGTPGATNTNFGMTSDKRIGVTNGSGGRHAAILNSTSTYALLEAYNYASGAYSNVSIAGAGGSVGVGLTNPSYRLHVNGSAGKPGGGSWTNASDKRLKDRIVPFQEGLASIMAIKPVKYHYNKLSGMDTKPEYVGVIAQELKEVAPYMVGTFEKDGVEYFDVDNSAMMYLLVNAVQEQQKEKETQTAKIESLEKQVADLNAKLNLLLEQK